MLQFTVPQFIDVEDKIIGPITTRQFLIMLSGFILIGISYKLFDFSMFVVVGLLIFAIFGVFAFLKINGMPFHFFVLNFLQTNRKPKLRVWNKVLSKVELEKDEKIEIHKDNLIPPQKQINTSRLAELSLIVDTQGSYKGGAEEHNIGNLDNLLDSSYGDQTKKQ